MTTERTIDQSTELKHRVQRSFSRSFASYHQAAGQQSRIADRLVQDLRDCGAPQHFASALELGCGTGHLTQRLCAAFGFEALTVNDLSPEAEETARAAGARFRCGDATGIEWPQRPELIASASMIQWLPDPAALLRRAAAALAPGGWLAIAGFGPQQYRELAQVGSAARAPGLCMPQDLAAAVQAEMDILAIGDAQQILHFATPRTVLEHLRKTGVNGRAKAPWSKSRLRHFLQEYVVHFGGQRGVPLTYHAIWLIARKRG